MNRSKPANARFQTISTAMIAAVLAGGMAAIFCLVDRKAEAQQPVADAASAQTNSVAAKVPAADVKPAAKHLSGAELYSMHCNRCHPERYPTERTAAQWRTILLHMRVRANLPAEQARTILKYLQDNSGR